MTLRGCRDSAGTDPSLPGPFGQASPPEGHNPLGCLCTSRNSCPLIYDSVFPLPLHVSLLFQKCPATCLVPTSWTSRSAHCHLLDPSSSLPPPLPPKRVQKKIRIISPRVCVPASTWAMVALSTPNITLSFLLSVSDCDSCALVVHFAGTETEIDTLANLYFS